MNDLVSIIMLSRRRARFVEESVRSVIAQTYQNWELLFVDDNSKDGTVSLQGGERVCFLVYAVWADEQTVGRHGCSDQWQGAGGS